MNQQSKQPQATAGKRIRAVALIMHDNHVLLMHRISQGSEYYVFVGGGVEVGETIEQAVAREVLEETSLRVGVGRLLYSHEYSDGSKQYFYLCDYDGSGSLALGQANELEHMVQDSGEFYEPVWRPINDLRSTLVYPLEIRDWLLADLESGFCDDTKHATIHLDDLRHE